MKELRNRKSEYFAVMLPMYQKMSFSPPYLGIFKQKGVFEQVQNAVTRLNEIQEYYRKTCERYRSTCEIPYIIIYMKHNNKINFNKFTGIPVVFWLGISRLSTMFSTCSKTTPQRQFSLGGSVGCATKWRPGGRGFNPHRGRQYSFVEIDHEIFSTFILSLRLIQVGQLSVSGERMCTILVNHLED